MARRMLILADGTRREVVQSLFSRGQGFLEPVYSGEKVIVDVVPLREVEANTDPAWEPDRSYATDSFQLSVGVSSEPPEGGTFKVTYKTDTSEAINVLTDSDAGIQAKLNAMGDVSTDGGVTVEGSLKTGFRIRWNDDGIKDDFGSDDLNLFPVGVVLFNKEAEGASGVRESILMYVQKDMAGMTESHTTIPAGSMSVNTLAAGSRKTREKTTVLCAAASSGSDAVAQIEEFRCVADVAGSLDGTYFTGSDSNGTVGFWFDIDDSGTEAPAAVLALDRAIEISGAATGDDASTVAAAVKAAINADDEFTAYNDSGTAEVRVVQETAGAVADIADGDAGITNISVTTNGADAVASDLDGKHFILYETNGAGGQQSRAFWFNVSGTASPSGTALTAGAATEINTVDAGDAAVTVASAVATAIDALDGYSATHNANSVMVESSIGYAFADGSAETSGFTVTKTQDGGSGTDQNAVAEIKFSEQAMGGVFNITLDTGNGEETTGGIEWHARPDVIRGALEELTGVADDDVVVEGGSGGDIRLSFRNNLESTAITVTVDDSAITWIEGFRFTLNLNTSAAKSLLFGVEEDEIDCIMELLASASDSSYKVKLFSSPITLKRGIIDEESAVPVPVTDYHTAAEADNKFVHHLKTITSLTGGTSSDLDSMTTAAITPERAFFMWDADNSRHSIYMLRSGTEAENSPDIIRPDDFAASTNEKYFELVWSSDELDTSTFLKTDGSQAGTGWQELKGLNLTDPVKLTISSGAVARTQSMHTIEVETGSSDTLTTITGGSIGDILFIRADDDAKTITVEHGTGANKIYLWGESDVDLDNDEKYIMLVCNAQQWHQIGGTGGGGTPDYVYKFDLYGDNEPLALETIPCGSAIKDSTVIDVYGYVDNAGSVDASFYFKINGVNKTSVTLNRSLGASASGGAAYAGNTADSDTLSKDDLMSIQISENGAGGSGSAADGIMHVYVSVNWI